MKPRPLRESFHWKEKGASVQDATAGRQLRSGVEQRPERADASFRFEQNEVVRSGVG